MTDQQELTVSITNYNITVKDGGQVGAFGNRTNGEGDIHSS